ncbi:MAG: hypothetical protein A2268_00750 [Candidatus Raymondbacteria bacterium RifOxyA12_full_50_37]|uniref:Polymerase/histidinol phosphatase N-terminal domain-containing protein n=1 Tax=Candidatus Raymondbacteria bacterium RIFOXYD12_FULL_49_13 TaxID=1817890 RepID=A0A1F7F1W0_UNCRA|nr:MAG: hypothetical protein A2268_00750 [Candidatus Raymondbacteria bacterium RifOxyA12_full_50_37]OGJ90058.1 MAG: hypothetical protein A2248_19080 [Candidatus Raymondbacteria bacterium RIFOXYA2_FULL_49_16]OGJ92875.1 MAG: hypothetical protein A2487_09645 [Candidatus Raymondbacteria bacterium RifOxyC12_full_50_8]OGJ96699.1 MAG: hypothetical protein A2350_01935 [Candidatus Raymondbacteria bacterium RifOxyB12_full_50_8]OGJ96742.1 MAG: hypothetical protein A2453_06205 [Candidatus Raymondbacteria b
MKFRNPLIPELLAMRDFADTHAHTNYADGADSIEAMAEQAQRNGLHCFALTEHVRANGLTYDYTAFAQQVTACSGKDFMAINGTETKVLDAQGALDISPELAHASNLRIASFHDRMTPEMHRTAVRAMLRNPLIDIWGHPCALDADYTIDEWISLCLLAKQNGVVIEVSNRYPMPAALFDILKESGCGYLYASDAHDAQSIRTARSLPVIAVRA